ncbi:MAG: hypothetical protein ACP5OG_03780 [Candidatus Nanoarchaeia archaeon]
MAISQKHLFWEALIIAIFIFGLGIFGGVILENWRTGKISELYQNSEIEILDAKLQTEIYSAGDFNCDVAIRENVKFAGRIYEEALILGNYMGASRLTDKQIRVQHKKYDLLRAMLFTNSMYIKEKCNATYHNVVYLYQFNKHDTATVQKQNVFSRILMELKEEYGGDILLIPMAADNNITSIEIILDRYNIYQEDLPLILIDEKIKVTEIEDKAEIEKYFQLNKTEVIKLK